MKNIFLTACFIFLLGLFAVKASSQSSTPEEEAIYKMQRDENLLENFPFAGKKRTRQELENS